MVVGSLFICHTPLHVLIAERIIQNLDIKNPVFIYYFEVNNDSNNYYFDKISRKYISYKIRKRNDPLRDLISIIKSVRKIVGKAYDVYVGNLKSFHSRFVLSLVDVKNLNTFDDGSGNISKQGYFYDDTESWFSELYFKILNKSMLYRKLRLTIERHFTIFNFSENVFQNSQYIQLFNYKSDVKKNKKKGYCLFISNVFTEDKLISLEEEQQLIRELNKIFLFDGVIRHPREKFAEKYISKFNFVEDSRISEEVIFDLSSQYDLTVVGVFSTVLLNVMTIDGIKVVNCNYQKLKKPVKGISDIFSENKIYNFEFSN